MIKKVFLAIVFVVVVAGGLVGLYAMMIKSLIAAGANQTMPPEAVATTEVIETSWEKTLPAVGSVVAFQGVSVVAEADGVVREILFDAGKMVEAGTVLLRLDTDIEEAQLRAAQARLELAETDAVRAKDLFDNQTISRAELDSATAGLKSGKAEVERIQAIINKKSVRAPFTGRLGIRRVSLGQYLKTGDPVVSLQSLDPVFVEFLTPQQNLSVLDEGLEVRVASDAFPDETFTGLISALNPQIDVASRNLRVQATLRNPEGRLRPGMFVDIDVVLSGGRDVIIIPQTAILYAPYGNSVFVVEDGEEGADGTTPKVARQEFVRTGQTRGDFIVVTSGLKAGERVVTSGAFKLRNGAKVVESDIAVATPELNPTPENS